MLFAGLDLRLAAGAAAVVTGPNGVGKSSLLRLCAGLLAPAAGRVVAPSRTLLGEAAALDPELPLGRALDFWARLDGGRDRVAAALEAVELATLRDVPVKMLSTGQRRRAALARVVASGAALWLARRAGERAGCRGGRAAGGTGRRAPGRRRRGAGRDACAAGAAGRAGGRTDRDGGCAMLIALIARDVRRGYAGGGATLVVIFFLLVATLFPSRSDRMRRCWRGSAAG